MNTKQMTDRVQVRFPADLLERVVAISEASGLTVSEVIRQLVARALA